MSRNKGIVGTEAKLVQDQAENVVCQQVSEQPNSDTEKQQRLNQGTHILPGYRARTGSD